MSKLGQKLGKVVSQWSTLQSGPLAAWESAEKGSKAPKSLEPVAHFEEWTTSFMEKAEKRQKSRKGASQWTTGCPEKYSNLAKSSEKSRAYAPLAD